MKATVAVLKTRPETILEDYRQLMHIADYEGFIDKNRDTIIKLNLSWTKYFPACSSQPWQLEGIVRTLLEDGFSHEWLLPVENKTVVTNPHKGARNGSVMGEVQRCSISALKSLFSSSNMRNHARFSKRYMSLLCIRSYISLNPIFNL
jgi:hypothetical protein